GAVGLHSPPCRDEWMPSTEGFRVLLSKYQSRRRGPGLSPDFRIQTFGYSEPGRCYHNRRATIPSPALPSAPLDRCRSGWGEGKRWKIALARRVLPSLAVDDERSGSTYRPPR